MTAASARSGVSPGFGFRVSLFRGAWVSGFAHFAAGFRSGFGFRLGGYPRFARPLSLRQYNLDLRAIVRLRTAVPVISTNMHINTSPVCIVGPSLTSRLHCRTVCIVGPSALPSALLDRLHCRAGGGGRRRRRFHSARREVAGGCAAWLQDERSAVRAQAALRHGPRSSSCARST